MNNFSNQPIVLSPGWELGDPFSEQSGIITVNAGDGVGSAAQKIVLAKSISGSARAYISHLSFRVVDMAGYDQLYFSLRRNGALIAPWEKISGEQIVDEHIVPVGQEFGPGLIEIGAINISGTTEPGASAQAGPIRVIGRFAGWLLR